MVSAATARNVLMMLLVCTTTMYLAPVGKKDAGLKRDSVRQGVWGPPTGDFDWCEENYPYSEGVMRFVAEPWNTFSNLAWHVLALTTLLRLIQLGLLDAQAALGLGLTVLIGTGSFIFHATLLYEAQLIDELPMANFALLSAWLGYSRRLQGAPVAADSAAPTAAANDEGVSFLKLLCMAYAVSLVPWMALTSRESIEHGAGRVVMSVSFTVCFISLGYSTSKMVEELREVLPTADGDSLERIHTGAFAACVCAILGWITDSLNCDMWQNLPFGLPYPQLHATVWHNFILLVVLFVILLQLQHRWVFLVCGGSREVLEKNPRFGRLIQSMLPPSFC